MSKVAVYIATTAGPVRIERVTAEDVPLSEVFEGRGYKPLEKISYDYDKFVRPGGPVNRAFGDLSEIENGSFRMDISGRIDAGNSWELSVLVAHGLHMASRLAGPEDEHDEVLLLTGKVDADLKLGSVGHIAEKLKASNSLIEECVERNCSIKFGAPPEENISLNVVEGLTYLHVENANQILKELGLSSTSNDLRATEPVNTVVNLPKGNSIIRPALFVGVAILILFVVLGLVVIDGFDADSDTVAETERVLKSEPSAADQTVAPAQQPKPTQLAATKFTPETTQIVYPKITILELRAPTDGTCAGVQFGRDTPKEAIVSVENSNGKASSLYGLCGLEFIVDVGNEKQQGAFIFVVTSGKTLSSSLGNPITQGVTPFVGSQKWRIDLPKRMENKLLYRVAVLTGGLGFLDWAKTLHTLGNWKGAIDQIKKDGHAFEMIDHEVVF